MRPMGKQVIVIDRTSATNGATATGNIDRLDFDYCELDVWLSTSDSTSNNPSVLNLLECDTTVATSFVTVSGFVGDTDFTIPAAVTEGSWGVKFRVDCRARKRYLRLAVSPTTTQVVTAVANLFNGDEAPLTATKAGVKALVSG